MTDEEIIEIDKSLKLLYNLRKLMPQIEDSLTKAIKDVEDQLVKFITLGG